MNKSFAARLFPFVQGFYFPFVVLLNLSLVGILALLCRATSGSFFVARLLIPVIVLFAFTLL